MKYTITLPIAALVLSACAPAPEHPALSGRNALEEVHALLDISPRDSGTENARRAAGHIADRLRSFGLDPQIDEFQELTPAGKITFRNVLAEHKGKSGKTIILGSHYDTKSGIAPDFEGANDSGSSTGLLLELARSISSSPAKHNILFAFFDGEESVEFYSSNDGLHGSKRLAGQIKTESRDIRAVIILDMIGDRNPHLTLPRNSSPELISKTFESARELGIRKQISIYGPILDDHVPFLEKGYPAIDLIDFEYGSAPGKNDYWHTAEDTRDKLSAETLETVGNLVLNLISKLD